MVRGVAWRGGAVVRGVAWRGHPFDKMLEVPFAPRPTVDVGYCYPFPPRWAGYLPVHVVASVDLVRGRRGTRGLRRRQRN